MVSARLATAFVVGLVSLLWAVPANAAPAQAPLAEVLKALKVAPTPSDYVIIVDTSGSMTQDDRYGKVKTALNSMLKALQPTDRVALVTFDKGARVAFDGPASTGAATILARLPVTPTGQSTDIGAGIDAGLKILEAANAKPLGAIALVTDGKVDAPGSPYADPRSPAWGALKNRASAVASRHEIGAYALGLISTTDAALLHQPFPDAIDIPASQFSSRLAALQQELLKFQAGEDLKPDLQQQVTAAFAGIDWASLGSGDSATGTLTLTSTYARIPVTVTGLTLASQGDLALTFDALPAEISLAPGGRTEIPLVVRVPATTSAATSSVTLSGAVTSPWQSVMSRDLGLEFAPALAATTPAAVAAAPSDPPAPAPAAPTSPPWPLIGAGVGAVAIVAILVLVLRSRGPRLVGSLAITQDGRPVREFLLTGRSATLEDASTPGLKGTVIAQRTRDGGAAIRLTANTLEGRRTATLGDRESAEIAGYFITYTAQHTRMMSMIQAGLGEGTHSLTV